ncbi:MAG: T9SS type A sorting domain-containing protein [Candidatus Kapaibacterium sp.]
MEKRTLFYYFPLLVLFVMNFSLPADVKAQKTSDKLKLLQPEGGIVFQPGDTIDISWQVTRPLSVADTVRVEYSPDGGNSWKFIADVKTTPLNPQLDVRSYSWVVPPVASNQVVIRVRQISGYFGNGEYLFETQLGDPESQSIGTLQFAKTSPFIAIGLNDTVYVLNVESQSLMRSFPLPAASPSVAEHPDFVNGDSILIIPSHPSIIRRNDPTYLSLLNVYSGEIESEYVVPVADLLVGETSMILDGVLIRDKSEVVLTGTKNATILDKETGTQIADIENTYLSESVDYNQGTQMLAVSARSNITVLDAISRTVKHEIQQPSRFVQFGDRGRVLLGAPLLNQVVSVWDAETANIIYQRSFGNRGAVFANIAYDADALVLWRYDTAAFMVNYRKPYNYYEMLPSGKSVGGAAAVSPDGKMVAVSSKEGKVVFWSVLNIPSDSTKLPITIDGYLPFAADITFAPTEVDKDRDTVAQNFISNFSNSDMVIQEVVLSSGDINDFLLFSGSSASTLKANSSLPLELRFSPIDTGWRRATVEIRTDKGRVYAEVNGYGTRISSEVEEYQEIENSNFIQAVYPQPSSDYLIVRLVKQPQQRYTVTITNSRGEKVYSIDNILLGDEANSVLVNTSELNTGVYFLMLSGGDKTVATKFSVVH